MNAARRLNLAKARNEIAKACIDQASLFGLTNLELLSLLVQEQQSWLNAAAKDEEMEGE